MLEKGRSLPREPAEAGAGNRSIERRLRDEVEALRCDADPVSFQETDDAADRISGVYPVGRPLDGMRCLVVDGDRGVAEERASRLAQAGATARACTVPEVSMVLEGAEDELVLLPAVLVRGAALAAAFQAPGGLEARFEGFVIAHRLPERQRQVMWLLISGLDLKDIGSRLGVSYTTARFHLAELCRRCEVRGQSQVLALFARFPGSTGNDGSK